jgi:hypothetical protein
MIKFVLIKRESLPLRIEFPILFSQSLLKINNFLPNIIEKKNPKIKSLFEARFKNVYL